ncbi:Rhomboid domain-containing protein 2, variant 2 [Basidiobolus ranarum]|uniref:Rhomboid domain-containing protein 2, variant 2 n=1 Tax=Basidiobolus ranarum TaxID=34480 RepID=A0ABR2WWE8_9FUNG
MFERSQISLSFTLLLAICCSITFVLTDYDIVDVRELFNYDSNLILKGQVYRFISYPLAHEGLLHLLVNLLVFIPLGLCYERYLKNPKIFLYTLFLVFSFIPAFLCFLGSFLLLELKELSLIGCSGWCFILSVWLAKRYSSRMSYNYSAKRCLTLMISAYTMN